MNTKYLSTFYVRNWATYCNCGLTKLNVRIKIVTFFLDHRDWSPKIQPLWTNGPQPIWSPYSRISAACPSGQTEYSRDHLSGGIKLVGDHLSMGPKFLRIICPWGLNWLQTVCAEGPINWGQMSGDHMRLRPNVSQPKYGI